MNHLSIAALNHLLTLYCQTPKCYIALFKKAASFKILHVNYLLVNMARIVPKAPCPKTEISGRK